MSGVSRSKTDGVAFDHFSILNGRPARPFRSLPFVTGDSGRLPYITSDTTSLGKHSSLIAVSCVFVIEKD